MNDARHPIHQDWRQILPLHVLSVTTISNRTYLLGVVSFFQRPAWVGLRNCHEMALLRLVGSVYSLRKFHELSRLRLT